MTDETNLTARPSWKALVATTAGVARNLYADLPNRRARQLTADLVGIIAVWASIRVAIAVTTLLHASAAIAAGVAETGQRVSGTLNNTAGALSAVPLLDGATDALRQAGQASAQLQAAAHRQQDLLAGIAVPAGILTGAILLAVLGRIWLRRRIHFAVEARAVRELLGSAAGRHLLATRTLAALRPDELVGYSRPGALSPLREHELLWNACRRAGIRHRRPGSTAHPSS